MNLSNAKQKEVLYMPRSCEAPYLMGLRLVRVYVVQKWIYTKEIYQGLFSTQVVFVA